jgi:transposase-like protein
VRLQHFENKARQSFWLVHIEAWQRSGLSQASYCHQHRLTTTTFDRRLTYLAGKEAPRKHTEYQAQLRREKRREEWKKRQRRRCALSTDVRNRVVQAFWAMHVEAMNWSSMGVREYAAGLRLSPSSLRRWRDRFAGGEVEIDWRTHLHPSARPLVSTSANGTTPESSLTNTAWDEPTRPPVRRFFSDDEKRAIALESDQPGASVSSVARKHGIVTGMLFRWRVQFELAQKKGAKLASVTLPDDTPATLARRKLVQPPDRMMAVDLPDGRRMFAPEGSDPDAVCAQLGNGGTAS